MPEGVQRQGEEGHAANAEEYVQELMERVSGDDSLEEEEEDGY